MYVSVFDADGGSVNGSDSSSMCYPNMPICLPCWPGCKSCQDSTPCRVQEDGPLRASVLAFQGVFMFLIFVSMLVAYQHRRNRVSQIFWLSRDSVCMKLGQKDNSRLVKDTETCYVIFIKQKHPPLQSIITITFLIMSSSDVTV